MEGNAGRDLVASEDDTLGAKDTNKTKNKKLFVEEASPAMVSPHRPPR